MSNPFNVINESESIRSYYRSVNKFAKSLLLYTIEVIKYLNLLLQYAKDKQEFIGLVVINRLDIEYNNKLLLLNKINDAQQNIKKIYTHMVSINQNMYEKKNLREPINYAMNDIQLLLQNAKEIYDNAEKEYQIIKDNNKNSQKINTSIDNIQKFIRLINDINHEVDLIVKKLVIILKQKSINMNNLKKSEISRLPPQPSPIVPSPRTSLQPPNGAQPPAAGAATGSASAPSVALPTGTSIKILPGSKTTNNIPTTKEVKPRRRYSNSILNIKNVRPPVNLLLNKDIVSTINTFIKSLTVDTQIFVFQINVKDESHDVIVFDKILVLNGVELYMGIYNIGYNTNYVETILYERYFNKINKNNEDKIDEKYHITYLKQYLLRRVNENQLFSYLGKDGNWKSGFYIDSNTNKVEYFNEMSVLNQKYGELFKIKQDQICTYDNIQEFIGTINVDIPIIKISYNDYNQFIFDKIIKCEGHDIYIGMTVEKYENNENKYVWTTSLVDSRIRFFKDQYTNIQDQNELLTKEGGYTINELNGLKKYMLQKLHKLHFMYYDTIENNQINRLIYKTKNKEFISVPSENIKNELNNALQINRAVKTIQARFRGQLVRRAKELNQMRNKDLLRRFSYLLQEVVGSNKRQALANAFQKTTVPEGTSRLNTVFTGGKKKKEKEKKKEKKAEKKK